MNIEKMDLRDRIMTNFEDNGYNVNCIYIKSVGILDDGKVIVKGGDMATGVEMVLTIPKESVELFL